MNKFLVILCFLFSFNSFGDDFIHSIGFLPEEQNSIKIDYLSDNGIGTGFDVYLKGKNVRPFATKYLGKFGSFFKFKGPEFAGGLILDPAKNSLVHLSSFLNVFLGYGIGTGTRVYLNYNYKAEDGNNLYGKIITYAFYKIPLKLFSYKEMYYIYAGFEGGNIHLSSNESMSFLRTKKSIMSFFTEGKRPIYGLLFSHDISKPYSFSLETNLDYFKFAINFGSSVF